MINRRNLFALAGAAAAVAGCTYNNGRGGWWRGRRRWAANNPAIVARTLIAENTHFEVDFPSFIDAANYCEDRGYVAPWWGNDEQISLATKFDRLVFDMRGSHTFMFSAPYYTTYEDRIDGIGTVRLLQWAPEWKTVGDARVRHLS